MRALAGVFTAFLFWTAAARASDDPLNRDGPLSPGYVYTDSDGAEDSEKKATDPLAVFVPDTEPDDRWDIGGPSTPLGTTPSRQSLVAI
jgi:hypothetical protein